MNRRRILSFVTLALVMALCLGAISTANADQSRQDVPQAGGPQVVSYQGQVVVNGVPFTGTGYFKFALIDGATTFWTNDGTASGQPATAVALSISNGLFNVLLGDTSITHMVTLPATAFSGTSRSLRVWFSTNNSTFTQLTPDQRVASVPYALQAEDSNTLDGIHAGSFATSTHDHWGQTWTGSGTGLTLTGGTIGLSGSGSSVGVNGISDTTSGKGVYGGSTLASGLGFGVYGQAASSSGYAGYFRNGSTSGNATAVYAYTASTSGLAGYFHSDANTTTASTAGVYARDDSDGTSNRGYGLAGHAYFTGTGVGAWSYGGRLFEGFSGDFPGGTLEFYVDLAGNVYANGTYGVFSTSRLDGTTHATIGLQATEEWLEDFGRATLENGAVMVVISPDFAGLANLAAEYHVFLTPEGDSQGLYVTNLTATTFEVREQNGGKSNIPFSYRIVAKPIDAESVRLPAVDVATRVGQTPERPAEGEP